MVSIVISRETNHFRKQTAEKKKPLRQSYFVHIIGTFSVFGLKNSFFFSLFSLSCHIFRPIDIYLSFGYISFPRNIQCVPFTWYVGLSLLIDRFICAIWICLRHFFSVQITMTCTFNLIEKCRTHVKYVSCALSITIKCIQMRY